MKKNSKTTNNKKSAAKMSTKKVVVIVLAVVILAAVLMVSLSSCTNYSKIEVIRSENFTVSAAMVTYSLYDTYHYYYNYFGEDMLKLYFGIDPSKSLAEQYSDAEKGVTWFDVFETEAIDGFCNALALCEAAVDAGIELSDVDKKYIDSELKEIETLAQKDGMTLKEYIKSIYGKNVKEEDVKKSLEIFRLANKMRYKDYNDATVSAEEIQAILDKEGDTFLMRDVIYLELTLSNEDAKTEKIKEYATRLKNAATEEEFRTIADEFLKSEYCVNKDDTKKIVEEKVQNTVAEDDKTAIDNWMFASTTTIGSTYVREETTAHIVYMAVSEAAMDESATRNMYTIVFEPSAYGDLEACKAKAEEVYALWENSGKNMDTFKTLAAMYTTDYVSVSTGGYYPNVRDDDMIDVLNDWLFEATEIGESVILKSEYGYHIMVYAGEGEPAWKVPVIEDIKNDKTTTQILNYIEQHEVTVVQGNLKYVKAK